MLLLSVWLFVFRHPVIQQRVEIHFLFWLAIGFAFAGHRTVRLDGNRAEFKFCRIGIPNQIPIVFLLEE
jgi:hypothetical protein